MFAKVVILVAIGAQIWAKSVPDEPKCGYESCHPVKSGFINVHLVPHTHDDVGWLKTVDQYYFGTKSDIQKAGVQYILDSVLDELRKDSNRRFIYVETAFLWKWWKQQHDFVKHQFKKYIRNGQLEIIGGGWSMNDEAVTNYQSIIDQFTWGFRRLNDTFGKCARPKVGWQIDPFGHSSEMASIFAQLGFDGVLLGRIDYQDKVERFRSKTPEMVWEGSDTLGNASRIFTSVLYNTYAPPPGFCFDILCSDDPIIDDKKSPEYNVEKRWNAFRLFIKNQAKYFKTPNVILTMGGDFTYTDAAVWYKNLDKLISHANKLQSNGSKYNLLYSTPSCYLKAVHDEAQRSKTQFQVKTDDFFPYASDPHAYWTGYYTSKPTLKRFERLGNNFLQVCKQLYAMADLGPEDWADLNALREAMGVLQHHDAISGTEKDHVAHDYARILSLGFEECELAAATALSKFALMKAPNPPPIPERPQREADPAPQIPFQSCLLSNVSQCELSENSDSFIVTIYSPQSQQMDYNVRIPVSHQNYMVKDLRGRILPVQFLPVPKAVQNIPGRNSRAIFEMVFVAKNCLPLGYKSYYVHKSTQSYACDDPTPMTETVSFKIDETTGLISEVTMNKKTIPLKQEFLYYRGSVGDNSKATNRSSGAYIFRPNGTAAYKITTKPTIQTYKGPIVTEVHQTFNEWLSQIIRVYQGEDHIEFDWVVGPIPMDDISGKEVITRFTTNIKSDSIFYTDSNGRELLKRVRDFRPTFKVNSTEPIASNYYPVTSMIVLREPKQNVEVAVLTDRAQGGSSLSDGEIELMIHRNCRADDGFGVGEALNETAFGQGLVVRGSHYLFVGPYYMNNFQQSLQARQRIFAQQKLMAPWTFLSPSYNLTFEQYDAKYNMHYAGLRFELNPNVHILTLEPWYGTSFLLRLGHLMAKGDDPSLSKSATVDLEGLFKSFQVVSLRETTLGANQWLDENERLQFEGGVNMADVQEMYDEEGLRRWTETEINTNELFSVPEKEGQNAPKSAFEIKLSPMQIRTFIVEVKML